MRRASFLIAAALAVAAPFALHAQSRRPLAPVPPTGQRVAPFFDGWYENADGSVTLSFGYSNLNRDEVVEIPLGPDNLIEPKEFHGRQPTSFPPARVEGPPANRRDRERGVFTVRIPPGFKGDVVWTLRAHGQTHKVPGRARAGAYQLRWPMAMGSVPPLVRFKADGPAGRGPVGIDSDVATVKAGAPLSLMVFVHDDSQREQEIQIKERGGERPAINVNWYKHSGPGVAAFSEPKTGLKELQGTVSSTVSFDQAGAYVLRVRADNFGRVDTSAGNQCCWTNGYVRVTVK
jgi:hypothetical protein